MDNSLLIVSVTAMFFVTVVVLAPNTSQHSVDSLIKAILEIFKHLK